MPGASAATETAAAAESRDGFYRRHRARIRGAVTFIYLIVLWELAARFIVRDERILAPFVKVVAALVKLFRTGEIWKHLSVSGYEFAVGFGLAAVVGIAVGFLMGTVRAAREYLDPWVAGLYAAPLVALAPFFIMFFG